MDHLKSTTSTPIIQATNIHKRFANLEILKGVSLEVFAGEIVAIVGASGAGKTTLLQILGTLLDYDSGTLHINGVSPKDLSNKALSKFRNLHIGFVFQAHQLLPEFTALENTALPAMLKGLSKKEAFKEATFLLERFGLSDRLNHKPAFMSGGEKQRTAVARALINRPSLIFADEPTGALDSGNKEELHSLFQELQNELGQTFVIVSHDNSTAKIANKTIYLKDGVIVPTPLF